MEESLIRAEVLNANRPNLIGDIVFVSRTKNLVLFVLAMLLFLIVILFTIFGNYTRHTTISGVVHPIDGDEKIFAQQPGFITNELVHERQKESKVPLLIRANNEHRNSLASDVEEEQTKYST